MKSLVRVRSEDAGCVHFESPLWSEPLLSFERPARDTSSDHELLHIEGGALADPESGGGGHLEFRSLAANDCVLGAVQDFVPRLWWPAYAATQAHAHVAVMHAFGRHLAKAGASA